MAWLGGALALIRKQPARLMLIALVLQFLMGFSQVGLLALILIVAIPALTAGMMQAMLMADHGARPPLAALFAAFTSGPRMARLLLLGALILAGGMLAVMLVLSGSLAGLDPALLARLEAGDISAVEELPPGLVRRLMLSMLAGLLVSGSLSYFAVPLVWFRDCPLGLAIRSGLVGMLRNWAAFLVLALLLAVLAMPVAILTAIVFTASQAGAAMSPVFTVLMLLLVVAFQLTLFAAQYCSYRDVFGAGEPEPVPQEPEDQLVA